MRQINEYVHASNLGITLFVIAAPLIESPVLLVPTTMFGVEPILPPPLLFTACGVGLAVGAVLWVMARRHSPRGEHRGQ